MEEVPAESKDFVSEKQNSASSQFSENNAFRCKNDSSSISMPICFLVKEQAKSQVAIQDLQKRIQQLEGIQNDVVIAISEVHDYLSVVYDSDDDAQVNSSAGNNYARRSFSQGNYSPFLNKSALVCTADQLTASGPLLPGQKNTEEWKRVSCKSVNSSVCQESTHKCSDGAKGKDSALESDKQDSGLDSDCREHGQEYSIPQNGIALLPEKHQICDEKNEPDELLNLLDEIGEKSNALRQQVMNAEEKDLTPNESETDTNLEMTKLQLEQLGLHSLLSSDSKSSHELKKKIVTLENVRDELACEKNDLEQRLMKTLDEKHKLESQLSKNNFSSSSECSENRQIISERRPSKLSKRLVHKFDAAAVSSILKETNVIDLQKYVLTYMMEIEVLHTKLIQLEQEISSVNVEKMYLEKVHKEELRQLLTENEQLHTAFEEQRLETSALWSKVKMLERVLESVRAQNQELNYQLGESLCLREMLQNPGQSIAQRLPTNAFVNSTSKHLNLPVQNLNQHDLTISCSKSKLLSNASSFIDVTIENDDDDYFPSVLRPSSKSFKQFPGLASSTPAAISRRPQVLKFADVVKSPLVFSPRSASSNPYLERHMKMRTQFRRSSDIDNNDVKNFENKHATSESSARRVCDVDPERTNQQSSGLNRNLDAIKENTLEDPPKFPFYSIIAKLKSNSDYKVSSHLPSTQRQNLPDTNISEAGDVSKPKSDTKKIINEDNNDQLNTSHDENVQTKEKRKSTSNSKNIHKRIQDILDRITAETDEAAVV